MCPIRVVNVGWTCNKKASIFFKTYTTYFKLLISNSSSLEVNFSALSVGNFIKTYGVNVYPNPSEGIIKLANPNNLDGVLQIYDMVGREILINKVLPSIIDLTSYVKGIYFIRIIIDNNVFTKNVIIK